MWLVKYNTIDVDNSTKHFREKENALTEAINHLREEGCDDVEMTFKDDGSICLEGSFLHHLGVIRVYCSEVKLADCLL